MSRRIRVATNGELVEEEIPLITACNDSANSSSQVNNPSHYQSHIKDGIDCITAMQHAFSVEEVKTFCRLNSFKYLWRASSKGRNQSIEKAIWYLNKFLELGGYE